MLVRRHYSFGVTLLVAVGLGLAGCGSSSSKSGSSSSGGSATGASLGLLKSDTLTVGSDTTYPPDEYSDPNNPSQYIGNDVDLANALGKAMGLKGATIVKGSFDALIPALQAKRYDVIMSSMNDTPERAKSVSFGDYMRAREAILVNASSGIHANTYKDMCGKSVAVERGTTELIGLNDANKTCSPKIQVLSYTADTDAYQAFVAGHAQAYTGDLPVVLNYVKTSKGKYKAAGPSMSASADYGIAVRKSDKKLKAALTKALAKIRASGQYTKILNKWGVSSAALK
jgi:polar amino acid transport system substrate-binding protein